MNAENGLTGVSDDGKVGTDHYTQAWNGPVGLTISWIVYSALVTIGVAFVTYSWIDSPDVQTGGLIGLTGLVLGGIYFFYMSVTAALFRNSIEVKLEGDEILGWGVYRQHKRLRFDDIASIKPVGGPGRTLELRSLSDPGFRMRIDPAVICFGELMEKILARAENLREMNLKKLPEKADCWYKLPDLAVIRAAEERARHNQLARA
jgi:hypothetical protein